MTVLLGSTSSASTSLWGRKLSFKGRPCMWQLQPEAVVPALQELSACMLLLHTHITEWTGFDYKAPGGGDTQLGLGGTGTNLSVWLFGEKHSLERDLKLHEWHTVCFTWSGRARRLRIYINGTSKYETSVNPIRPQQLAPKGSLTLGVSHYIKTNGEVQQQTGKDLLGEIGLFRMWAREWSAEELRGQSCADGDVVRWDLRQWQHNCQPEPDNNLHCAVPAMWLMILLLYLHNNLSSEVYVNVDPAANVEVVQANIASLLSSTFSYNFLNLTADPNSISILPVELLPAVSEPLPTVSSGTPTPETGPTQSLPARPTNMLTTGDPLDYNETLVGPDTFFRVNLNLSMYGSPTKPEDSIEKWVKEQLEVNGTMIVLNLIIKENVGSKLDFDTDTTSWAKPDMKNCKPFVIISDLDNITVTTGNAAEVVEMIQDLVDAQLGNSAELSSSELDTVVEKLREVVAISSIKPAVGADIVNIVAVILLSETLLNLTDRMGNNMNFQEGSISISAPSFALSMINVDQNEFSGLTFGVSFDSSNLNTEDPHTTNATQSSCTLNSFVVSACINNSLINNLKDGVVVTLRHRTPKQPEDKVQCVFWDFQKNGGRGGWNSRGCETRSISANRTSCLCDHLTHFAVLLDVSRTPISDADSQILTVISYLGCGISSIFLGITLLTYLAFEKLRRDYPSKILINLSAAMLGLSMLFLLDSWLSSFSNYSLCIATAATLHYFLLASFTWMGLEAVHMYFALVKVFNIYIPSYILKFCAVGWGIPLVIVSLVLAIDKDAYGSAVPGESAVMLQSTDQFCWLQNDVFFYVTVVAFVLLIMLCNTFVFIVVLIQIRQMSSNKHSANSRISLHDLRAVASLTVLLGLTWSMGFFSFGPGKVVLMYLFTIFNTLQGFFVFFFHCLMKENVRKQWRMHLCCGRFRLSDYSDGSDNVTMGGRCKKNHLINSDSVASDNTSTIRKASDSSTGSTPNHHQGA
ncbi:adhesion G protein-coupled receptor G4a [Anarhichas minor]|uniref:adhesion G protein-coupled receptor G4a n=1 Tax=Anarhichas minor TaxID=65739 RepID=UPI003F7343D3